MLLRVASVGICGSDVGFLRTEQLDVVPGHEIAGLTEDGRPFAIQPDGACRSCGSCVEGRTNVCASAYRSFLGVAGLDGGLAEWVRVPADRLRPLPPGLPVDYGALAEPAAVAVHAVSLLPPVDRVAVVGGGTIGIIAAVMLREVRPSAVLVARHPHQVRLARRMGLDVAAPGKGLVVDGVLDTAGSQSALEASFKMLRPHGHLVTVGAAPWAPVMNEDFMYRELTLKGSIIYTDDDFSAAIRFLDGRHGLHEALVTHRFALDRTADALVVASSRAENESIKVLVSP